jgi:hypothetical protein
MNVTSTKLILDDLETLSSLKFEKPANRLWPHYHSGDSRRDVLADLCVAKSPLRLIKTTLVKCCMSEQSERKMIVYSNSRQCTERMATSCRNYLNERGHRQDIVTIHGQLFRVRFCMFTVT